MKKSLSLCLPALLLATSCVNSLTDYNIDPKSPASVSAGSLVTAAELGLAREMVNPSVNVNPFRFYVQYWAETQYPDETNYNIATRQINRTFWRNMYLGGGTTDPTYTPGVLSNLNIAKSTITADNTLDASVKANQLACVEVLAVYGWTVLVDTYGNVPYKQALDYTNGQPAYDDAATIYSDLFVRLNAAIASMKSASAGLGSADVIYGGNMASWLKFANSLKLRMAITTVDADAARAKTQAEQAASAVFTANADDATFKFSSAPPNANPLWENLVQSGRKDFVGTSIFIDTLKYFNDPRLPKYFSPVGGGTTSTNYVGGNYGDSNDYASASNPGTILQDPALPAELESYAEVEFLLAEAVARGFNVGGTITSHYNAAITASIQSWGGSAADAATYLAQPSVAYATAAGSSFKTKIGNQEWIALYNQPVQAWNTWRRLDTPVLLPGADALSPIPLRFPYPFDEQNINATNYAAAASAIGGDKVDTKIFWDKY
ncbi:MAG: SusD/RagB family nutrient-binding outer membrane lipoprotein [Janthinobacterium lividum]